MLPRVGEPDRADRVRVLFINSPTNIGADTWIHLLLMRHLPQARFELHAAVQPAPQGQPESPVAAALRAIPGVSLQFTSFGPTLFGRTRLQKLGALAEVVPALASLVELAAYIRRHRIQVLHATDRPRDALACVLLARLTGAKALIHVHVKFDQWMSRGQKWALGQADALVGVSRFVAASLVAGGYRRERVKAVLNAIDPERWDPTVSGAPGRAALGVTADAPLLVSVSRLFSWKGHTELLRALALVKRALPEVRLAIVGADYPEGSGTTRALSALASELGVAENVIFTGQRSDIAALLAACDVFALPSFEEPFGLVYTEAMAMRRPVIGLDNGGTPEVVAHGEDGLLSAPKDIEGLAANVLTLLRDPALRARLGAHGRARVEDRFGPARLAADFGALYAELASQKESSGA
jgi:glycosyltransferase involved in cell wall biosynthesis